MAVKGLYKDNCIACPHCGMIDWWNTNGTGTNSTPFCKRCGSACEILEPWHALSEGEQEYRRGHYDRLSHRYETIAQAKQDLTEMIIDYTSRSPTTSMSFDYQVRLLHQLSGWCLDRIKYIEKEKL